MKKIIIIGLVFLLSLININAITFSGFNVSSSDNSSVIYFDTPTTSDEFIIRESYVSIINATFNNYFWINETTFTNNISLINWSNNGTFRTSGFIYSFQFYEPNDGVWATNYQFGDYNSSVATLRVLYSALPEGSATKTFTHTDYTTQSYSYTVDYGEVLNKVYTISLFGDLSPLQSKTVEDAMSIGLAFIIIFIVLQMFAQYMELGFVSWFISLFLASVAIILMRLV